MQTIKIENKEYQVPKAVKDYIEFKEFQIENAVKSIDVITNHLNEFMSHNNLLLERLSNENNVAKKIALWDKN